MSEGMDENVVGNWMVFTNSIIVREGGWYEYNNIMDLWAELIEFASV